MNFSEQIKTLREKEGWSQADLAERLKVRQSTVSRWEGGVTSPVGLYASQLEKMLKAKRKSGGKA